MTAADSEAMAALQDLVRERQRYEGWLGALEGRRASTPEHVYNRVHTDYSLRLERVLQRLSERTEQLRGTLEALQTRLQAVRARETDRTDARQEAELRAMVGEYTPEEWDRIRTHADQELTALAQERAGLEAEASELQRIMGESTRSEPGPGAPAQTGAPASPASPASPAEPEAAAASPALPAAADASESTTSVPSTPPPSGAVTAATAVTAVTAADETAPAATAPAATTPAEIAGGESPSIDEFVAEWPLASSAAATGASSTAPQANGAARPSAPAEPTPARPATSSGQGSGGVQSLADRLRPPEPPVIEGRRENEKTLKCPECSAMNYATEWYCERCGGELSSF